MNPNHHGVPQTPDQQYQLAMAYMAHTGQASANLINRSNPSNIHPNNFSPQVLAALQQQHHLQQQIRHHPGQPPNPQQQHQPQFLSQNNPTPANTNTPASLANPAPNPKNPPSRQQSSNLATQPSLLSNLTPDQLNQLHSSLGAPPQQSQQPQHLVGSHSSPNPTQAYLGSQVPRDQQAHQLLVEQNRLIATITAAKQGRLSAELTQVLFTKIGPDNFRNNGLGHLLDHAGNLIPPTQQALLSNNRNLSDSPHAPQTHQLVPSNSLGAPNQPGLAGPSVATNQASSVTTPSMTPQPHQTHTPGSSHSRQQSHHPSSHTPAPLHPQQAVHQQSLSHSAHHLQQQQQQQAHLQQHQHAQTQQHPPHNQHPQAVSSQQQAQLQHSLSQHSQQNQMPRGTPNEDVALAGVKRCLALFQQIAPRLEFSQRCLNEGVVYTPDYQSSRVMTPEDRLKFENDAISARGVYNSLYNQLCGLVSKNGMSDQLATVFKKLAMPNPGALQGGSMPNPAAQALHQPRPNSSPAHQNPTQQQQAHHQQQQLLHAQAQAQQQQQQQQMVQAQSQLTSQHLHTQAQQQLQHQSQQAQQVRIMQAQADTQAAQNQEQQQAFVHAQQHQQLQQQQQQQAQTPQQSNVNLGFGPNTPQQQPRQLSQNGNVHIPSASPASHLGPAPGNSAEHLARFQTQQIQQQYTMRSGSPRQPGSAQPPRPPSAAPPVPASGYALSPNPTQSSPPNNTAQHQQPVSSIQQFFSTMTTEKFVVLIREGLARKGMVWNGSPLFRGKELDLFKMFGVCTALGGFDRITNSGLWGHVAVKIDVGCNSADKNDVQMAAGELREIYRVFCLDFEQMFVAAVQKQHLDHQAKVQSVKPQAHQIGQSPSAHQQVTQVATPQAHATPQPQYVPQSDQLSTEQQRSHKPDGGQQHPQQSRAQLQQDHLATDPRNGLALSQQHSVPHPQSQSQPPQPSVSQSSNTHPGQGLSVQHDPASQNAMLQPSHSQVDLANRQQQFLTGATRLNNGTGLALGSSQPTLTQPPPDIMAMSDEQLRELNLPEDTILKIRIARAQRDPQKQQFATTALNTQPVSTAGYTRPSSTGPAPAWNGPQMANAAAVRQTSYAEEAVNNLNVMAQSNSGGSSKQMDALSIVNHLKQEATAQAQIAFAKNKLPQSRDLTAAERESYTTQMEQTASAFQHVMSRLPEYLAVTGRLDYTRQIVMMALVFHLGYVAFKNNEYILSSSDLQNTRASIEGVRTFFYNSCKPTASSPPPPRPPSQQQYNQPQLQQAQVPPQPPTPQQVPSSSLGPQQFDDPQVMARAAQPPTPMAPSPHFSEHLKQGLRVEDLKQPPPKRIKTGAGPSTTIDTSPDRLMGAGMLSPAPDTATPQGGEGTQAGTEAGSPVCTSATKSPGVKGKRQPPGRGGPSGRGGRKSSTPAARTTTKTSYQIMAEVKAEHAAAAAAKARAQSEAAEQHSKAPGNQGTVSIMLSGPSDAQSTGSLIAQSYEGVAVQQTVGSMQPPTSTIGAANEKGCEQAAQVEAEQAKPPALEVEDLLTEFWNDTLLSGTTNNGEDEIWRGLIGELDLTTSVVESKGTTEQEDLSGSWLLEEMEMFKSVEDPLTGVDPLSMYVPPGMETLFEEHAGLEIKERDDEKKKKEEESEIPKVGLQVTKWRTGEESSTGKKSVNGTSETPEFSPSKLSNDSTPESVCSNENAQPGKNPEKAGTKTAGSSSAAVDAAGTSGNFEGEEGMMIYMMGFEKGNEGPTKKKVALINRTELSEEFWTKPFMTTASSAESR